MSLDAETMLVWCRRLLGIEPREALSLNDYLGAVGRLESLSDDVPSGTPVLVRGDVDAKPGATVGEGDVRLRSMKETLEFGRSQAAGSKSSSATLAAIPRSRSTRSPRDWAKSSAATCR